MAMSHRRGRADLRNHSQRAATTAMNGMLPNNQGSSKGVSGVNKMANNTPRQPVGPGLEGQARNLASSGIQELELVSRSFDIKNPAEEVQSGPKEAEFPPPQRANTNPPQNDLAEEVNKLKLENKELREQNTKMRNEKMRQVSEVPSLQEKLSKSTKEINHWVGLYNATFDKLSKTEREFIAYQNEDNKRQKQAAQQAAQQATQQVQRQAQESFDRLNRENESKKEAWEAQNRLLLDKITRDKVEGRWTALPDSDIKHRLNNLNKEMRDWAQAWANKSLSLDKGVNKETVKFLSNFVRLEIDNSLPSFVKKPSGKNKDRIPSLLLHAALAYTVQDAFFDSPFFCTTPEQTDVLEELHKHILKADPRGAHLWRISLWRLLNPIVADDPNRASPICESTKETVRRYCETVNENFRKGSASVLLSAVAEHGPDAQNRANRLRAILNHASQIATSLWTQNSFFRTVDLRYMGHRKMTFDIDSTLLQGHGISKVNPDDEKFNGLNMVLVARPALLAFDIDDANNKEDDQYRVLAPAIVVLEGRT